MSEEQVTGAIDPETGVVVEPEVGNDGVAVGAVPEVPEVNETEEFFQTKYQNLVESLKAGDPEVYARFQNQQPQGQAPAPVEQPTPSGDSDEYATIGTLLQMEERLAARMAAQNAEADQRRNQEDLQAQYKHEYTEADSAIKQAVTELKIPQDVVTQMHEQVGRYRIDVNRPTGPSGYAHAFLDLVRQYKPAPVTPQPTDPALIAAADAARTTGLMAQPVGGRLGVSNPNPAQQIADTIIPDSEPYVFNE